LLENVNDDDKFINKTIKLLHDDSRLIELSKEMLQKVRSYHTNEVVKQYILELEKI